MNEIEKNKTVVKKNGERREFEVLNNNPNHPKTHKQESHDNNIQIFDKNAIESAEIAFEEVKEKGKVKKVEDISEGSSEGGEKEVRLTEVIEIIDDKKGIVISKPHQKPKVIKKEKDSTRSKRLSKVSSKYTSQTNSKRKTGNQILKPKKSILITNNKRKGHGIIQKSLESKKNIQSEKGPLLSGKRNKDDEYTSDLDEEESSAVEEEESEEERSLKTKNTRISRISRKSKISVTQSEISEKEAIRIKHP